MRFLIANCYKADGREEAIAAGVTPPEDLFRRVLETMLPNGFTSDVVYAADPKAELPHNSSLSDYDGLIWSGSSLTIYHDVPEVRRQIEFAREVYKAGLPSYGSCWGLQVAATAADGTCRQNPRGLEVGLARSVQLTSEGRGHPMFAGKPAVFDCPAIHYDEVELLPASAPLLASNRMSQVQAAAIEHEGTPFWAVQYHPEYDLKELASIMRFRARGLIGHGYGADEAAIHAVADDWETLHVDPSRKDIAWKYGIDLAMLEPAIRFQEIRNFVRYIATPRAALRTG